jgi:hypothetical protein
MSRKRRKLGASLKAKVALAAVRGDKTTALLAFASSDAGGSIPTGAIVSLGLLVCGVWALKIRRHKDIFTTSKSRLEYLQFQHGWVEETTGILGALAGPGIRADETRSIATRPSPNRWWLNGFNLMYALVLVSRSA